MRPKQLPMERGNTMQEKREKEFNLLESPWVKVVTPSLEQNEVSLTEAIVHAHEYGNLSGEMATQDAAVLRVGGKRFHGGGCL